jgi:hypothetical protein
MKLKCRVDGSKLKILIATTCSLQVLKYLFKFYIIGKKTKYNMKF